MDARPPWWLIAVAALLAALVLFESVGPLAGAVLFAVSLAVFLGYRFFRARIPPKLPAIYCLNCGRTLPPTARHCQSCGSARWSYKN